MSYHPSLLKKAFHYLRRQIAKNWLKLYHPLQIGITGSQGKTTTAQILAEALKKIGNTVVTDVNLDTNFNVPITALKVTPWTKFVVFELGIDHIGEMDKHLEVVKPTIGIITGISPVHTDKEHLGSIENLIKEKRKLIEKLPSKDSGGIAFLNFDDDRVRMMAPSTLAKVFFYGKKEKHCHFFYDEKSVKISFEGTVFSVKAKNENKTFIVKTKLLGSHFASNLTAVFGVLSAILKESTKAYKILDETLKNLKPLKGRMSLEKGPLKTFLLNDSLRANPKSTSEGLKTFYEINYKKGRKIAVLGVMGELYDPITEHKKTADVLIKYQPDIILGVGDYRKYTIDEVIKKGFPKKRCFFAKDVFEAAEILKKIIKPDDFIYLKGSLLRNLWRIIKILNGEPVCCKQEICPYSHCKQ